MSQRHPTEPNVYDLIPPDLARPDLAAFGRLDRDTTGMLLFGLNVLPMVTASVTYGYSLYYLWLPPLLPMVTGMLLFGTDGGVQSLLLSPSSRVWKTYTATLADGGTASLVPGAAEAFAAGMVLAYGHSSLLTYLDLLRTRYLLTTHFTTHHSPRCLRTAPPASPNYSLTYT